MCLLYSGGRWGWAISALIDCKRELLGLRLRLSIEWKEGEERRRQKSMNVWIFWTRWQKNSYFWIAIESCEKTYHQRKRPDACPQAWNVLVCTFLSWYKEIQNNSTLSKYVLEFSSSPLNKNENYYHENDSSCVPPANSLPWTHVNTSWVKLSANSQRVRTAEREASRRALRLQLQENSMYKRSIYRCPAC